MVPILRWMRILAGILLFFSVSTVLSAATGPCDRACLKNTLDQFLDATIKLDPSAVPLWVGFRQTENALAVKEGTGLWKTMTGLGKVQRRFLDPVSQQAGYFGEILEGDATDIVTLRLRIVDRQVADAEWVIARTTRPPAPGRGPSGPEGLEMSPPPDKPLAKSARSSSRDGIVAAANSYFDGLQAHDGSLVHSRPGCVRIENGGSVTGVGPGRSGKIEDRGDCAAHYEQQTMLAVVARRYPVVDEEAGVVLAMVIFQRRPGAMQRRNLLSEWIFVENDKITGIWAAMFYPTPETPAPNWPPYEGNWPLPETLPNAPEFPTAPPPGIPPASPTVTPGR